MKRHALSTRIWHWVNAFSVVVLFMSGLNISNAHRHLYWGKWGFEPATAWLHLPRFPGWATIPNYYSLSSARDWHLIFAWVFGISLLLFLVVALLNGHLRRDIATRRAEWSRRNIGQDIRRHLRFDFSHGDGRYNFLQKASYGGVIFILLPVLTLTGLTMSPGMNAAWPFLLDIFGGRQSARSIHFICAWLLCAFFAVHLAMVLLSGPIRQIRAMITGGSREDQHDETA